MKERAGGGECDKESDRSAKRKRGKDVETALCSFTDAGRETEGFFSLPLSCFKRETGKKEECWSCLKDFTFSQVQMDSNALAERCTVVGFFLTALSGFIFSYSHANSGTRMYTHGPIVSVYLFG